MGAARTFELGINYWPRRRAMYMWRDFDLAEIRDELAHIADMGFDTVRLAPVPAIVDVSADAYDRAPASHFERLYARWLSGPV